MQAQIATGDVVLGVGEDAAGEQRGGNGERSNALQSIGFRYAGILSRVVCAVNSVPVGGAEATANETLTDRHHPPLLGMANHP